MAIDSPDCEGNRAFMSEMTWGCCLSSVSILLSTIYPVTMPCVRCCLTHQISHNTLLLCILLGHPWTTSRGVRAVTGHLQDLSFPESDIWDWLTHTGRCSSAKPLWKLPKDTGVKVGFFFSFSTSWISWTWPFISRTNRYSDWQIDTNIAFILQNVTPTLQALFVLNGVKGDVWTHFAQIGIRGEWGAERAGGNGT